MKISLIQNKTTLQILGHRVQQSYDHIWLTRKKQTCLSPISLSPGLDAGKWEQKHPINKQVKNIIASKKI